jgi:hypothetical protein
MTMPAIDWMPTIVATVSAFILGGLWYSPLLFARAWQRETGLSDEQLNAASKAPSRAPKPSGWRRP